MTLQGQAWKFGDNINTDIIIAGRYLNITDIKELSVHCMEDLDINFTKKISKNDILVAGKNFGCGSSREHAPLVIKEIGIACVLASSFGRIFFRNSINIGLPIFELKEIDSIKQGDLLAIDFFSGAISNLTRKQNYLTNPFPGFIQKIFTAGGLINYVNQDDHGF